MSIPCEDQTPWRPFRKFAFPLLWILIIAFFVMLHEVLAPFIGAVLIAYLLAPLTRRVHAVEFKGRRIPRWGAVLLIYASMVSIVVLYSVLAVPKVSAEFQRLAAEGERFVHSLTPEKIDEYTLRVKAWIEESGLPVRIKTPRMPESELDAGTGFVLDVDRVIRQAMADATEAFRANFFSFLTVGPRFAARLVRQVIFGFLILMVAAFLLANPQRLFGYFKSLFPGRLHDGYQEVLFEIDRGLAGVVRGQVLICLVNGGLTFIGMVVLGVKFPVLLSTLAAVFSLIPIFGSILSSVPIVAVGVTTGLGTGFGILVWIIGIHLLEANFLNPKIIGDATKIHPGLVVFVLVAGEHLYGVLGALFAVPILSVGLAFFKVLHRRAMTWNQEMCQEENEVADAVDDGIQTC
jgi:predicted PurR-regulated permease PerM